MPDPEPICGVTVAFTVVAGKWKPTIVWVLAQGTRRFAELRREVGEVSEKVLAAQLRELERDGVVHREAGAGFPLRVEYSLTPVGRALDQVLEPLAEWGHRHEEALRVARATDAG